MSRKTQMLANDAAFPPKRTLKDRLKNTFNEYGYISFAALIPIILFFLTYILRFDIVKKTGELQFEGLYPFGNGTVLVLDLNGQYVYFFEALRNAVLEGGTLLYSWSRALGGEFLGLYAYYLASPLSYLVCLFPKDRTQEFLYLLFAIKAALCGGTMAFYLHKHSAKKNKLSIVTFAVMYAMSAYCVIQQSNTMWIDAVMWLPLVTYGVEQLIKYGKYKLFVIFLSLTIASNFYIGYMVCIFVFLYFFFYHFAYKDDFANNPCHEKSHFLKSFVRIGVFSIIAIGISAVMVLGAYYSLQFGKTDFSNPDWDIALRIDFFDILFKMLPSSYDTVRIDGLPFIYCGLLTAIFAPLFFCCKKFTTREKVVCGIFLAIFLLSFLISVVDLVWHGFQKPQWLNNRYSFIFCFFLLTLAFRAFEHIEYIPTRSISCVAAFIFMVVAVLQCFDQAYKDKLIALSYGPNEEDFSVHTYATVALTIVCLAIYLIVVALMRRQKNKEFLSALLLGVVCVELTLSSICNVIDFDKDVGYSKYYKYSEFQPLYRPAVETLLDYDTTFYRFEKTHYRKINDNMALKIRGLSNSTSTLNASTISFLHGMGYYSKSHKSQYKSGNPVSDSLLGLKYIISDRDLSNIYGDPVLSAEDYAKHMGITVEELAESTATTENLYKNLDATKINVYYNKYALPIAFAAEAGIFDVNMKDYNNEFVNKENDPKKYEKVNNPDGIISPFDRLNLLITEILGEDEIVQVFKPAIQNGEPTLSSGVKATTTTEHYKYTGKEGSKVTYSYTVPENVELFSYFPAFYTRNISISSPDMPIFDETVPDGYKADGIEDLESCNDRIVHLGHSEKDEYRLVVKLSSSGQFYTLIQNAYVYYLDMEVFEDAFARIQAEQLVLDESFSDDKITGHITTSSDNRTIMTTIPYDEGWEVYVDGERVAIKEALGALITFEIDEAGMHDIKFVYSPTIVNVGIIITVISFACFVLIIILEKYINKLKLVKIFFVVEKPKDDPDLIDTKKK